MFLTVTADTALFRDDRELRRLVRDPLRSTSIGAGCEVGWRRDGSVVVAVGLLAVVRMELARRTAIGELIRRDEFSYKRFDAVRCAEPDVVVFRFEISLAVVTVESDDGVRTLGGVVVVASLHDDSLSLPCDGVSETRLCVSSNPSSFSSGCDGLVCLMMSRGGLHTRSGASVGVLRLRFASRTSSGLMELSLRPTIPMRAITRCLVGSLLVAGSLAAAE